MIAHGETNPRGMLRWAQREEMMACLFVSLQITHLYLQQRQILENLQIVLLPFQGIAIALNRLIVLFITTLEQTVDMPADMATQIVTQAKADILVGLLATSQSVQG